MECRDGRIHVALEGCRHLPRMATFFRPSADTSRRYLKHRSFSIHVPLPPSSAIGEIISFESKHVDLPNRQVCVVVGRERVGSDVGVACNVVR